MNEEPEDLLDGLERFEYPEEFYDEDAYTGDEEEAQG